MKNIREPADLVDEELSAVSFVRDYVEFHFDGPVLRTLAPVRVISPAGGDTIVYGEDGWRDRLCSLIGGVVDAAIVDDERGITPRLGSGDRIVVPLDQDSRVGPEAAHYVPFPRAPLMVW